MDEVLKNRFEEVCSTCGIDPSAAVRLFAEAAVREHLYPFDFLPGEITREKALAVFEEIRAVAAGDFPEEMTDAEIEEEICRVRCGEVE
jgi:addiction module RelB/DinJ family antitoxin